MLILGDLTKIVWGADYRSIMPPAVLQGSISIFGSPFPKYNLFLLVIGPLVAIGLWLFSTKTKMGKIARAAAVDMEMVGAIGINVSWVFAFAFVLGCFLGGLGGALVSPTISVTIGMDHNIIIEHRSLFNRHHRRIGKHVGRSGGFVDLRHHSSLRGFIVAAVCDCFSLSGGRYCPDPETHRHAQIRVVERNRVV